MNDHFVVAGAQRCGTTFLYRYLAAHPEIEMAAPERPEPKFFLRKDLGDDPARAYRRAFFGGKPGARRFGEKSTSYLESEEVARRLAVHLPGVRVVVALRDPVDRAISNVRFSRANGLETRSVDDALCPCGPPAPTFDPTRISVDPFAYVTRGVYADYFERYLRHLPRERLHVVVLEEFVASDEPLLGLLDFLGVSRAAAPVRPGGVNTSSGRRPEVRCRRELEELYGESIARLERLLGRRFDCWPTRERRS